MAGNNKKDHKLIAALIFSKERLHIFASLRSRKPKINENHQNQLKPKGKHEKSRKIIKNQQKFPRKRFF